jgi:hypothetical protein
MLVASTDLLQTGQGIKQSMGGYCWNIRL